MHYTNVSQLFFNWPATPKPPIESFPITKEVPVTRYDHKGNQYESSEYRTSSWEIQMALAGFTPSDIKVWTEEHTLHIKGSNLDNANGGLVRRRINNGEVGIADKFTCSFHHKFACNRALDLDNASVKLKDGLLMISIPVKKMEENRRYLFGSKPPPSLSE